MQDLFLIFFLRKTGSSEGRCLGVHFPLGTKPYEFRMCDKIGTRDHFIKNSQAHICCGITERYLLIGTIYGIYNISREWVFF